MLSRIIGDSGTGKTAEIARLIASDLAAGVRSYLIVPEQQAVSSEIYMIDRLPDNAPLLFEVTNFSRLSDTVFRMTGGLAWRTASKEVEHLTMWRTLMDTAPFLRNKPARIDSATVSAYRSIVRDLRAMRLSETDLHLAAANVKDPFLSDKLEDYALLSGVYHALLTEKYTDASELPDRLAEVLKAQHPLAGAHIYVDGFSSFTEQEYAILEALLESSPMTVTLAMPPDADLQLCSAEVLHTYGRLTKLAQTVGVPVCDRRMTAPVRCTEPVIRYVSERMFRVDHASLPAWEGAPSDRLRLVDAPDPREAADFVAADIRRRVEAGARYGDCTVICASTASYEGLLDTAFDAVGVPYFFSSRTGLMSLEPVQMLFSAYAVIVGGWRREDVIAYLRCGLAGVSASVTDEMETYADTWNLRGRDFTAEGGWYRNPDGFGIPTEKRKPYIDAILSRLNQAREQFVPPLVALGETADRPLPVCEHITALTKFLLEIDLPAALAARAEEWKAAGDGRRAEEYARLWDLLCDALDTLAEVLGDRPMNADDFAAILKLLLSEADMGHIPASMDEVTVGQVSLLRSEGKRHVYLLGVNRDEFPAKVQDNGTFTEAERLTLSEAGLTLSDSLDTRAACELFAFYRALTLSEETVTLLWYRADGAFAESHPSDAVVRIQRLLGADYPVLTLSDRNILNRMYAPETVYARLGRLLGSDVGDAALAALADHPLYGGRTDAVGQSIRNTDLYLTPATATKLYGERLSLTQSKIERYAKCPLAFYCRYGLHLKTEERAEFNAMNVGTFIHAILEGFFTYTRREELDFRHLEDAVRLRIVEEVTDRVLSETLPREAAENPRTQHLIDHLRASAYRIVTNLCEEFANSAFSPALFEVNITDRDPAAPAPITFHTPSGRPIYVTGVIDRVDTYTEGDLTYLRVVDYKTGTQDFDLSDVERGLNLQMLLYLFSLWKTDSRAFRESVGAKEGGTILPAGIMYTASLLDESAIKETAPLSDADAQARAKKVITRSGILLNDEVVLTKTDTSENGAYLPLKKQGKSFTKKALRHLKTLEEMGALMKEVGSVLSKIGEGMESGCATATPLKEGKNRSACDLCDYQHICRNSK